MRNRNDFAFSGKEPLDFAKSGNVYFRFNRWMDGCDARGAAMAPLESTRKPEENKAKIDVVIIVGQHLEGRQAKK